MTQWLGIGVAVWVGLAAQGTTAAAELKPGSVKARWPIKTSLPADANLAKPGSLISLSDFLALTAAAEHATTDFEKVRYPKAAGAKFGEGQIVRTRGFLRIVAGED